MTPLGMISNLMVQLFCLQDDDSTIVKPDLLQDDILDLYLFEYQAGISQNIAYNKDSYISTRSS